MLTKSRWRDIVPAMTNEHTAEIARKIKQMRLVRGLTQGQLGALTKHNANVISMWETGRRGVSAKNLVRLSLALRVPVDYLATGRS